MPPLPVGKHIIEFTVTDHLAAPKSELIKRDGVCHIHKVSAKQNLFGTHWRQL